MQQSQELVCMVKCANPSIPCCVEESITSPRNSEDSHHDGIWRVGSNDNVGDDSEQGCENGNSTPATKAMQSIAEEGRQGIASEGREEDE